MSPADAALGTPIASFGRALAVFGTKMARIGEQFAEHVSSGPQVAAPAPKAELQVARPDLPARVAEAEPVLVSAPARLASPASRPVPWTPARIDLLRRDWPAGVDVETLCQRLNALPGPAVTKERVAVKAAYYGVKRPPGFVPVARAPAKVVPKPRPPVKAKTHKEIQEAWRLRWSEARRDLVKRDYPRGVPIERLLAAVNALPGDPVEAHHIQAMARYWRLVEAKPAATASGTITATIGGQTVQVDVPSGATPAQNAAALVAAINARPDLQVTATSNAHHVTFTTKDKPLTAPKIAAPPVAVAAKAPGAPPARQPDPVAAQVAEFVAKKGVTRCPPAAVEAVSLAPAAAAELAASAATIRAHTEAVEARRAAQIQGRTKPGRAFQARQAAAARGL